MKPYPEIPAGLVVDHDGAILRIRLNRPDRRNSVTDPMVYALVDIFDAAASDESVRAIHLAGEGDHFCSGFDLGERAPGPDRPRPGSIHRRMNAHVNRLIPAMLTNQTPIVCTARGWVIGLGLDVLLASDFAIVADDARLWAPFTTFGFTPDSGASWLIPRLVGVARAKDMLVLGTKVPGTTAASWGLVHQAVPTAELEAAGEDLLARLASGPTVALGTKVAGTTAASWGLVHQAVPDAELDAAGEDLLARLASGPTVALGLTKLLVHRGLTADLDRHLDDEAWAMEVSSRSDDFKEYAAAAREKRDPEFRGR